MSRPVALSLKVPMTTVMKAHTAPAHHLLIVHRRALMFLWVLYRECIRQGAEPAADDRLPHAADWIPAGHALDIVACRVARLPQVDEHHARSP